MTDILTSEMFSLSYHIGDDSRSFSKWRSSAGQRLLLLHSGFIGIEIFHSRVKVQVVEKPKCSWVRQGRRKLRAGKVHHGGLGSKVRFMRVTPVWCWEETMTSFTFTTLLRTILGNTIYKTEDGG